MAAVEVERKHAFQNNNVAVLVWIQQPDVPHPLVLAHTCRRLVRTY